MTCPVFDEKNVLISFYKMRADGMFEDVELAFVFGDIGQLPVVLHQLPECGAINRNSSIGYEQEGDIVSRRSKIGTEHLHGVS